MPKLGKKELSMEQPALKVGLIGPMQIHTAAGELIELPRKVRGMFAYLVMRRGSTVPRQTLIGLLWGDRPDDQARSSLRQALSILKSALGDLAEEVIEVTGESISIVAQNISTDLDRIEDTQIQPDQPLETVELLEGLALSEPAFEDWLREERARARTKLISTEKKRAKSDLASGRSNLAEIRMASVARHAPTDEEAHRDLMQIYLSQSRTDMAIRQYERCKDVLQKHLNVEPELRTVELWQKARKIRSSRSTAEQTDHQEVGMVTPFLAAIQGDEIDVCKIEDVTIDMGGKLLKKAEGLRIATFEEASDGLRACIELRKASRKGSNSPSSISIALHAGESGEPGVPFGSGDLATLQELLSATPADEIYVSSRFFTVVRRNSPCFFEDLSETGTPELAGVFRVSRPMQRQPFMAVYTNPTPRREKRASSLAVAPIKYIGADPDANDYWAEGLTEDLILELSRCRLIDVCSRTTLNAIRSHDAVEIGKELGVSYVLLGSFRKLGQSVRLNFTLAEAGDGDIVWSERFEVTFEKLFDIIDEIVTVVAARVSGKIEHSEIEFARIKRSDNMTAYEYYLRGLWHHRLGGITAQHSRKAVEWFKKSLEADPTFNRPRASMICAWSDLPDYDEVKANQIATEAYEADPTDPEANRILGWVKYTLGDFDAGIRLSNQSVELAPHDAYLMGRCAVMHIFNGDPEEGIRRLNRAVELDPFVPVYIVEEYLTAYYTMGDYEKVINEAKNLNHQTRRSRYYTAASFVAVGKTEAAKKVISSVLEDDPALTLSYVKGQELFKDPETMSTLLFRLEKAGVPKTNQR